MERVEIGEPMNERSLYMTPWLFLSIENERKRRREYDSVSGGPKAGRQVIKAGRLKVRVLNVHAVVGQGAPTPTQNSIGSERKKADERWMRREGEEGRKREI